MRAGICALGVRGPIWLDDDKVAPHLRLARRLCLLRMQLDYLLPSEGKGGRAEGTILEW